LTSLQKYFESIEVGLSVTDFKLSALHFQSQASFWLPKHLKAVSQ